MGSIKINFTYSPKLMEQLSQTSGLNIRDCFSEMIDNAKEAEGNDGLVEVSIAAPNHENGASIIVQDYGCGMDKDDLEFKFFRCGGGDDEKPGVHAKMGGRIAVSKLCEAPEAYAKIVTKKYGCKPIVALWDGKGDPDVNYLDDETIPNGTSITIYNAKVDAVDGESYKAFAAMRYSPALSNKFRLKINGEEIHPEDPLYPEIEDENGVSVIESYEKEVCGPKDGKTYTVKYHVRDLSPFYEKGTGVCKDGFTPHAWDCNDDGSCLLNENQKTGAFVKIDDIYVVCGGVSTPYIKRKDHPQMKGKRLVIEFPTGLAKQLSFQMNKSAGFVDIDRVTPLIPLFNDTSKAFERVIQNSVTRAKTEHEDEVRVYKNARVVPGTKRMVKFSVNNGVVLPKNVFAMKDESIDGFVYNPASSLLKPVSGSIKNFKVTAGVAESAYMAVMKTLEDVKKFQPKFNKDSHPRTTAVSARDQVLDYFKEMFEENFMSMS